MRREVPAVELDIRSKKKKRVNLSEDENKIYK